MKSALLLSALFLASVPVLSAQDAPPPSPTPKAAPAPSKGRPVMHREVHIMERHDDGGSRGLMLPPGTWWKSPEITQKIGLSTDQQKRIEDIFLQSRVQLIDAHAALEKQELMLEPLLSANPIDQSKAFAQISKIADTRAELEKTNAKMLLGIRAVLTAEQWTKLQNTHHFFHGPERMRMHGPGGPDMHMRQRMDGPMPGPEAE